MDYMYGLYIGLSKNYCDHMSYTDNEKLQISTNIDNNDKNSDKNKNNISITESVNGHIIYIFIDLKSSSNSMI